MKSYNTAYNKSCGCNHPNHPNHPDHHTHYNLKPIDQLELKLAKGVMCSLTRLTNVNEYNTDLQVTVEINRPFLVVDVRAENRICGCMMQSLRTRCGDSIHTVVSNTLSTEGFSHKLVKVDYRYVDGVHIWSTVVELLCDIKSKSCGCKPSCNTKIVHNVNYCADTYCTYKVPASINQTNNICNVHNEVHFHNNGYPDVFLGTSKQVRGWVQNDCEDVNASIKLRREENFFDAVNTLYQSSKLCKPKLTSSWSLFSSC